MAHGRAIDWDAEERSATTDEEREGIRKLRVVAAMSVLNRAVMSGAASEDLSASISEAKSVVAGAPAMAPGMRWGPLEIEERVGAGAFGEVYRARDLRLDREVALKLLPGNASALRGEVVREARLLAAVRHPNVVTVHGADLIDRHVGIWTEFLRGQTLEQMVRERGVLDGREAALIGIDLCRALSSVHAAGIIHQDVKLSNVMRAEGGRIVLMDFGLGREAEAIHPVGSRRHLSGTPLFMAPEVLRGGRPDVRSDLYSLGVVLFALVTGSLPVEAATLEALREKHARGDRRHARDLRPDLSEAFIQVLNRALAPDPRNRFQTAGDAEHALVESLGAAMRERAGERGPRLPAAIPYRLRAETDAFVGRESDLAELTQRFHGGARLITLMGTGGIGKTRLAIRYAWQSLDEWPGGAWFCDLTEAENPDGLAFAVAEGLSVTLGAGDAVAQLGQTIANRGRCLVILDNFEQLVEWAGATVGPWLARAPEVRIVVTSRARLHLPGEDVLAIDALPLERGVELFVERGRRQRPIAADGPEADAVREVVRLVDGIPLAIELSAARLQVLTPAQIVSRMTERFRILAGSGHGRHATVKAAIDGSWELLTAWEKAAFAQCAVFEGGFHVDAAEGVLDLRAWSDAPWILDVLQSLVNKSLLRAWMPAQGPGAGAVSSPAMRFGMFVSLQEYAREKLTQEGAIPGGMSGTEAARSAERRHADWFSRLGKDEAIEALDRHGGVERRRALERELDNLVAACRRMVAQGEGEVAVSCCRAAWAVFQLRGPFASAVELGTQVLHLPLASEDESKLLIVLGSAKHRLGRLKEAKADLESAIALDQERGYRKGEGAGLALLGGVELNEGRMEDALVHRNQALAIHREVGDRRNEGITLSNIGLAHHVQGQLEEASRAFEAALAISREMGSRRMEGVALGHLAHLRREHGRIAEARAYFEEALAAHREVGNRYFEGVVLGNLASLWRERDVFLPSEMAEARSHFEAALTIDREVANVHAEGVVLGQLGTLSLAEGKLEEAREFLSKGEAILRAAAAYPIELATLLCTRAELEIRTGDVAAAEKAVAEVEAVFAEARVSPESEFGRRLANARQALRDARAG